MSTHICVLFTMLLKNANSTINYLCLQYSRGVQDTIQMRQESEQNLQTLADDSTEVLKMEKKAQEWNVCHKSRQTQVHTIDEETFISCI